MKNRVFLLFVILFSFKFVLATPGIKIIKNSLCEINNKCDKITLNPVMVWGSEDSTDDMNYFKAPEDIVVDNENRVYIADSSLHCIKVFDENGHFIRQIGRRGQGPGDLLSPLNISINETNVIWVNDFGNRRIQKFTTSGAYLSVFKTPNLYTSNLIITRESKIALLDSFLAEKGKGIILIYNQTGAEIQRIGTHMLPPGIDLPWTGGKHDSVMFSYNIKTQQYYIAYTYSQMIHIFDKNTKLKKCIFYDTPINKLQLAWKPTRNNFDLIKKSNNYSKCVALTVDNDDSIFIVISTRSLKKNEITSMTFIDGRMTYTPGNKGFPVKTDLYRLMVFGADGKILATKQLDVFCDKIYIHNNRIFIIDKIFQKVIYEYQYKIK